MIRRLVVALISASLAACSAQTAPVATDEVEMIVVDNFGPFTRQRALDRCAALGQAAEVRDLDDGEHVAFRCVQRPT